MDKSRYLVGRYKGVHGSLTISRKMMRDTSAEMILVRAADREGYQLTCVHHVVVDARFGPYRVQGQTTGLHGEGCFQERRIMNMEITDLKIESFRDIDVRIQVKEFR